MTALARHAIDRSYVLWYVKGNNHIHKGVMYGAEERWQKALEYTSLQISVAQQI